jgi:hypothetical protein
MIWCGRPSRRLRQHRQCVRATSSGRRGAVPLSSASKTLLRARAESLRRVRLLTQGRDSDSWELRLFHLFRSPVHSDRQAASGRVFFLDARHDLERTVEKRSRQRLGLIPGAPASRRRAPRPSSGSSASPSGEPSRPRRTTAYGAKRTYIERPRSAKCQLQ